VFGPTAWVTVWCGIVVTTSTPRTENASAISISLWVCLATIDNEPFGGISDFFFLAKDREQNWLSRAFTKYKKVVKW